MPIFDRSGAQFESSVAATDPRHASAPTPSASATSSTGGRDRMLDGFRAVAVLCVIFGHAVAYRYLDILASDAFFMRRILLATQPVADAGVSIFFAISGYIITSLMLREEKREGRFSLPAFYVRRSLRILPPYAAFIATIAVLGWHGFIDFEPRQAINAAAFTCNTGLTECGWFVAHSWSLAVEEQYYLVWPLLFTLIVPIRRASFATVVAVVLMAAFVLLPFSFHSNAIAFACIAAGAACALQPRWREAIERAGNPFTWLLAALFVLLGTDLVGLKAANALMPLLAVFLLFGGRRITLLRRVLESGPFQFVGSISYSLYLWQQFFLASPERYLAMAPPPVWLLPVVAWLSLLVIERPCIALAHRLSGGIIRKGAEAGVAERPAESPNA